MLKCALSVVGAWIAVSERRGGRRQQQSTCCRFQHVVDTVCQRRPAPAQRLPLQARPGNSIFSFTLFHNLQQWRRQGRGRGEASPLWVDVQKLCNVCVLSLSWNYFASHDKYIAVNVSASGGLRTLDPL